LLALFDNQVGLYIQIALGACGSRAQTALIQLIGNRLTDALFGQVALDPWIIGTVLQGGFFPGPAAIGSKIAAGVEVMIDLVGGTATASKTKRRNMMVLRLKA
jgi:Flp pilus assembly CpaE family ATPase